jgi:hypothetical protein
MVAELKYRYHDAVLESCRLGPRRELVLDVRLDPSMNSGSSRHISLRFSAIDNFDQVQDFFEVLAGQRNALGRIESVECLENGSWRVELDQAGMVTITTKKHPREVDV